MIDTIMIDICGRILVIAMNPVYVCRPEISDSRCHAKITCDTGRSNFDRDSGTISPYIESIELVCSEKTPSGQVSFSHGGELWMSLTCRR
jgi:hypothetical protein